MGADPSIKPEGLPAPQSLLIPDVRANVGPSMRESVSLTLGIPSQAEQMKNE